MYCVDVVVSMIFNIKQGKDIMNMQLVVVFIWCLVCLFANDMTSVHSQTYRLVENVISGMYIS